MPGKSAFVQVCHVSQASVMSLCRKPCEQASTYTHVMILHLEDFPSVLYHVVSCTVPLKSNVKVTWEKSREPPTATSLIIYCEPVLEGEKKSFWL